MKKSMKLIGALALTLSMQGCLGDTSKDNELTGQVKKVQHHTPLILPNYNAADVSLGVVRNGVGSMSGQDLWLYVPNAADYETLSKAAESGAIVKLKYNVARCRFYVQKEEVTHVEIVQ